jgi:hypothetical protein
VPTFLHSKHCSVKSNGRSSGDSTEHVRSRLSSEIISSTKITIHALFRMRAVKREDSEDSKDLGTGLHDLGINNKKTNKADSVCSIARQKFLRMLAPWTHRPRERF